MLAETSAAAAELGLGEAYRPWLSALDASAGDRDGESDTPIRSEADGEVMARLGVAEQDARVVLETATQLEASPGLMLLLRRCRRLILDHLGDPAAPPLRLPQLPAALGPAGRCFPAHLFLATLPATMSWQRGLGIPEDVAWDSFNDLGRHMQIYRDVHAETGVDEPWWLMLHLQGLMYEFGRLQFNLLRIGGPMAPASWYDAEAAAELGHGFRAGDDAIGVHIPESVPLDPQASNESVAAARTFFPRYFPAPTRALAVCESWLLDDQLRAYLPPTSNLIVFQRQFDLAPGWKPGDTDVAQFVFRKSVAELGTVPQRTTLQRAIVSHLRTGGHWRVRCGWLRL